MARVSVLAGPPAGLRIFRLRPFPAPTVFRWGGQDGQSGCPARRWTKGAGWNFRARNASSGAYGIPQSLPGSKMGTVAADWRTNPTTQITWGLQYIKASYGSPCSAWGHSQSVNWY